MADAPRVPGGIFPLVAADTISVQVFGDKRHIFHAENLHIRIRGMAKQARLLPHPSLSVHLIMGIEPHVLLLEVAKETELGAGAIPSPEEPGVFLGYGAIAVSSALLQRRVVAGRAGEQTVR